MVNRLRGARRETRCSCIRIISVTEAHRRHGDHRKVHRIDATPRLGALLRRSQLMRRRRHACSACSACIVWLLGLAVRVVRQRWAGAQARVAKLVDFRVAWAAGAGATTGWCCVAVLGLGLHPDVEQHAYREVDEQKQQRLGLAGAQPPTSPAGAIGPLNGLLQIACCHPYVSLMVAQLPTGVFNIVAS